MRPVWRKLLLVWLLRIVLVSIFASPAIAIPAGVPLSASWPHRLTVNGADATVYQPQAISWPGHGTLTARAAVAITPAGAQAPILGTVEIALATRIDDTDRLVYLSNLRLLGTHFPTLDTAQATRIEARIKAALPGLHPAPVPLDSILLSLNAPVTPSAPVSNDPPPIFYSDHPASLLVFNGPPVLAPIGKTGLSVAVNANWDVVKGEDGWYLLNGDLWLAAPDSAGPYALVSQLPAAFSAIPKTGAYATLRRHIPARPPKPDAVIPEIFVSAAPAEMIVTTGPPEFKGIPGTALDYVANTGSDLFRDRTSGQFYYLISGRWFAASSLEGPWRFATADLPADFSLIPPDSPRGRVLASVPGTAEAQAAVLAAQIPHQATLKKSTAKLHVTYAGKPRFLPVAGTPMTYAANTGFPVIRAGGRYYACYQGAWFVASSPYGPWVLAASVPKVIYTIPPASPLYPVTYVTVYGATPTTVTYGYTSGYAMGFVTAGVLVYGTGYYYPPVVVHGPVPIYYPYPTSYTGNVWYNSASGAWTRGGTVYGAYGSAATGGSYYNPATGAYAHGGAVYGPNGGAGAWSAYNPSTGAYAHGSASWNANGGSAYATAYNPRTGVSASTTQNANAYQRWGSSVVSGPNKTINTASGSNARGSAGGFTSSTGATGAGYHGVNGNRGGAVKTSNGDVYAGRDGNAYQHTSSGWSKWNDGGWQPVQPPSSSGTNRTSGQGQSRTQTGSTGGSSLGSTQSTGSSRFQQMNRSNYQQLQRDQQARTTGAQQWGQGRFQGGGFQGGGFRNGGSQGGRFQGGGFQGGGFQGGRFGGERGGRLGR